MSVSNLGSYVIQKNGWGKFGRIRLLWNSLCGMKLAYFAGILAMALETFCVFVSPVIVKTTIDSIIGESPLTLPVFLEGFGKLFFGPDYNGGGALPVPAPAADSAGWAWRSFLQSRLWMVALFFVLVILLQGAASFCASLCANASAEHAAKRMRDELYSCVQDLPYETLLRAHSGDWLQRCTSDVDTSRRFLAQEFMEILRTLFLVSLSIPSMYSLSPKMTFWGTLVIPLILLYSFGFHKLVERIFLGADEREGVLSGIVQENVTGVRVVRAFARQDYEQERFDRANGRYRDQVFKLIAWLGVFWGFSSLLGILQIGIVIGAGLYFFAQGEIPVGMIVLFLSYEHQTLWPVRQFGRVLADTGKTKVALGRMAELLALKREEDLDAEPGAEDLSPLFWKRAAIEFCDVSFAYPDGTEVLKNVSFKMESGERLAIVGPTGSGKSTLVHLLLRLYEPTSGRITIGGRDLSSIPKRELRLNISLVLQEGFLYGKTIRENIRIGSEDADEERIFEASRAASLHPVIEGFAAGYDTMVGERGVTLSGGQRQRLALARGIIRGASLLVLDDSLSAVDTETDARIREALDAHGGDSRDRAGMIVIAHRLTTLASADRIIVLEEGRITAVGTHAELSQKEGLYRRLAELQRAVEAQGA